MNKTLKDIIYEWCDDERYYNHPLARKVQIFHSVEEYIKDYSFYKIEEFNNVEPKSEFLLFMYDEKGEICNVGIFKNKKEVQFSDNCSSFKILEYNDWNLLLLIVSCYESYISFKNR